MYQYAVFKYRGTKVFSAVNTLATFVGTLFFGSSPTDNLTKWQRNVSFKNSKGELDDRLHNRHITMPSLTITSTFNHMGLFY